MELQTTDDIKAWIRDNRYHGMANDIAKKTSLTRETVRAHLKPETPETQATPKVLNAAMALIQARKEKMSKQFKKITTANETTPE